MLINEGGAWKPSSLMLEMRVHKSLKEKQIGRLGCTIN
jgi:hypothetical protein